MFKVIRKYKENTEKFSKTREWSGLETFEQAQQVFEEDFELISKMKKGSKLALVKKDGSQASLGKVIQAKSSGHISELGETATYGIETDFNVKKTWVWKIAKEN